MKAMILAAGLGTRMRPLTLSTPKPLLPVADKALIVYHLEQLQSLGVKEVVINVSHLADKIKTALGSGERWDLQIHYSDESEPLETAGGIARAMQWLEGENFLCLNGDIWSDFQLSALPAEESIDLAHLVLVNNPEHHPSGDFCLNTQHNQHGQALIKDEGEPRLTFSGISLLSSKLFAGLDDTAGRLAPYLRQAMLTDQVSGQHYAGHWFDVGTPERLAQTDQLVRGLERS